MDTLQNQLDSFVDTEKDTERVEDAICYLVNGNLFAIFYANKRPQKISLRCDPQLAKSLREQFESVMPAENLDRKTWNTIIITPQIAEKVPDLITHAYHLSKSL